MTLSQEQIADFRAEIWNHYCAHGRSFPWRETHDPYAIMVSEFMLQQTQTARVVEKYEAWIRRFPAVQSVAGAELSEVLSLWNGLGYNRRAKFLHEACRAICAEHGGIVPNDAESLDALPGIGAYTARAICAFAFGSEEVFVETSIRSVFIHFFFAGGEGSAGLNESVAARSAGDFAVSGGTSFARDNLAVSDSDILPLVEQTLDRENPREWYYALMDYGADLKKRGENPSRMSKTYAKQSRFEGSLRQARGAILRQLSQSGGAVQAESEGTVSVRGLTLSEISEREKIDMARLTKAAEKLIEEKMIRCEDGRYLFV